MRWCDRRAPDWRELVVGMTLIVVAAVVVLFGVAELLRQLWGWLA